MAEDIPNLWRDLDIQVHGAHRSQNKQLREIFFKTHYSKTVQSQRKRENIKSSKRKEACNLQGNFIRLSVDFAVATL